MATTNTTQQLIEEANRLLHKDNPELKNVNDKVVLTRLNELRKQLYIKNEIVETHRIENRLRTVARQRAESLLKANSVDPAVGLALVAILNGLTEPGYARRMLSRLHQGDPNSRKMTQKLSLNTYKDEALPPDSRFSDALKILS